MLAAMKNAFRASKRSHHQHAGNSRPIGGDSKFSVQPRATKSFSSGAQFKTHKEPEHARTDLNGVKTKMLSIFVDAQGENAERIRFKLKFAKDVRELWMLRSDMHQILSRQFNQWVACERINSLLPSFEGWIPVTQLVRI